MEVNKSPVRRNLGMFLANLCMYKGLPPLRNLCTKNPILMDWTLPAWVASDLLPHHSGSSLHPEHLCNIHTCTCTGAKSTCFHALHTHHIKCTCTRACASMQRFRNLSSSSLESCLFVSSHTANPRVFVCLFVCKAATPLNSPRL